MLALRVALPTVSGTPQPSAEAAAAGARAWSHRERSGAAPVASCRTRVQHVLDESSIPVTMPLPLDHTILAALPDPIDTPGQAVYDNGLEAIVEGLAEEDYVRDHFVLSGQGDHDSAGARCPDVVLFRKTTKLDDYLVLLLVGESSTWGVNKQELEAALGLLSVRPACAVGDPTRDEVRLLGPYHSGASASTVRVLDDFAEHHACVKYRAASGSMTAPGSIAEVYWNRFTTSVSFTRGLRERQDLLLQFLKLDPAHDQVAVLQESGTVYGRSARSGLFTAAREPRRTIDVAYPPNISALREAYGALESSASKDGSTYGGRLPPGSLPTSFDARVTASDMLTPFAPQATMQLHDIALQRVFTTLQSQRVGDVFVSGVLPDDVAFLSRRVKSAVPDMRVSLFQMESSFLSSEYTNDLRGALVVSAYPPIDAGDASQQILHSALGRDPASGIFHAIRWLVDESRPRAPMNLSLGVLSHGQFWPLSMEHAPQNVPVPGSFSMLTAFLLVLTLFNVLVIDALLRRDDRSRVRRYAWFLAGFLPCRDPLVKAWHQVFLGISQASVFSSLLILCSARLMLLRSASFVSARGLVAGACLALLLVSALTVLRTWKLVLSGTAAHEPVLGKRPALALLLGGVPVLAIGFFACCGMFAIEPEAWSLFLLRAVDVGSGVSPLCMLLLALGLVYHFALAHASRLRVIDFGDVSAEPPTNDATTQGLGARRRNLMLTRAMPADSALEQHENALFESTLLPGGYGYYGTAFAVLLVPVVLALYIRPGTLPRLHGLTLETQPLSAAMVLALLLSLGITATSMLKALSLWSHLSDVLRCLAVSDLGDAFKQLHAPFQRSVATQLAMGRQDPTELDAALHLLGAVPTKRDDPRRKTFTSLTSSDDFTTLLRAAESARLALDSTAPEAERPALRAALASYVAFGLTRWIKQFRFLIWVITVGTAVLLLSSTSYVFTVRRLFVTVFALLSMAGVIASGTIFLGVERDEVLSHIGGSNPGEFTFRNNLLRIAGWGLLPVALAVAAYFPDAMRGLVTWLDALGGSR